MKLASQFASRIGLRHKLRFGALAAALAAGPLIGSLGMVAGAVYAAPTAMADDAVQKVILGKVLDSGETPQPGAIVYLKNGKTSTIKSYIATDDGSYRFGQLATDTDYSLWAELQGRKSGVKTISAFDSKKQFQINLHLNEKTK